MTHRIDIVDLGRGAVMAIMALDHTRTFFTNVPFNPGDLTQTFPALFFTRWVSHLCTPMFVLLAGCGVYFMTRRRSRRNATWVLATRGLVLIAFELTLVRWGWYFNWDYRHTSLQVLWAIGVSMIGLAPLVFLPSRVVGVIGLAIVTLHNLLDQTHAPGGALAAAVWALLYERGQQLALGPEVVVTTNFPALPLFGVMALGYAFGEAFSWSPSQRRRACLVTGIVCLSAFVLLRFVNAYGDPLVWQSGPTLMYSAMSFLRLTKHPMSLLMSLATIGVSLTWLGLVRADRPVWQPLRMIGRVPMLFYLLHVPIIHALALLYARACCGDGGWLLTSPFDRGPGHVVPTGWGFGLAGVYAWWLLVLALCYAPCAWYAGLKARSKSAWLTYL